MRDHPLPGTWQCPHCRSRNPAGTHHCDACGRIEPGHDPRTAAEISIELGDARKAHRLAGRVLAAAITTAGLGLGMVLAGIALIVWSSLAGWDAGTACAALIWGGVPIALLGVLLAAATWTERADRLADVRKLEHAFTRSIDQR